MSEVIPKTPEEIALLSSDHPDVLSAAMHAYTVVGERARIDPNKVHRKEFCSWASKPMRLSLAEKGYEFYPFGRRLERPSTEHMFLKSLETSRGVILVDGTWQQFVPRRKRDPALPKVIVGTHEEVVELAKEAGVKSKHLDFWKQRTSFRVAEEVDGRYCFGLYDD